MIQNTLHSVAIIKLMFCLHMFHKYFSFVNISQKSSLHALALRKWQTGVILGEYNTDVFMRGFSEQRFVAPLLEVI